MKKTNNPFKMWESYAGIVVYPLLLGLALWVTGQSPIVQFTLGLPNFGLFSLLIAGGVCLGWFCLLNALITLPVAGFLIGWLVGCLRRRR
jgi:hypothetical protein